MPPADDWRSLYPFESHGDAGGRPPLSLFGRGAGQVLLLVHGNPTWSFYWRELVRPLRAKYRVIVPDHIGCGLSEKPDARAYSYRLAQRVADLGQLIERLDLRQVTLVGHDWGGAIGMGAAGASPERFARFVLMNTAAFRDAHCPAAIRLGQMPILSQLLIQGLNVFARAALRLAVEHHERMTPAVRAGLLAPYDSWRNRVAVYRFVQDIPMRPGHPSYAAIRQIEAGLAQFAGQPICLIWGMRDWCFGPRFLQSFQEFFPAAEVHRLADAGHYVVEDAHERIVPLVEDFLERNKV